MSEGCLRRGVGPPRRELRLFSQAIVAIDHNVWYRGVAAIGGVNPNVNSRSQARRLEVRPGSVDRRQVFIGMLMPVIRASLAR